LVFAPVAGLAIGGVLASSYLALSLLFSHFIAIILTFVIYIVLTGGLHIDGLGDTFDGIFSNRPKERILEIMRDSRVGTNAVIAIVCVILLDIALLNGIDSRLTVLILVLMPVTGRIGSLIGAGVSKYARSGEGLGKSFIDYCGAKEILVGLALYIIIFYAVYGANGILIAAPPVLSALILVKLLSRKIGGATGDVLGAVCELNQTLFLMAAYVLIGKFGIV
jgi:adenosylcobinamide-GDP ribazoletransferase